MDWFTEIRDYLSSTEQSSEVQTGEYIASPEPIVDDELVHIEDTSFSHEDVGEFPTQPQYSYEDAGEFPTQPQYSYEDAGEFPTQPQYSYEDVGDFPSNPQYHHEDVGEFQTPDQYAHEGNLEMWIPEEQAGHTNFATQSETIGPTEQFDIHLPQEEFSSTDTSDSESYRDLLLGGDK